MIIIITTQYGQGPTDELSPRIIIRGSFADGLDNIHKRRYKDKSKYTVL
jgi:hypothetical protein